jgi:heterodisulfide reductase subunit D
VAKELKAAEEACVTTLAGIYHSDHRELVGHESEWSFEIINFMELIGESMGLHRDDVFKRLKMMRDVDAILADTADLIATYRLDPEEVREVVLKDIIGDQHLPLDRNAHAKYLADG